MMVTTTFDFAGYRIRESKGLVRGIIVRSPTIKQGCLGGLAQLLGGQIQAYTEMCEQTRQQACEQLVEHATAIGATPSSAFAMMPLNLEESRHGSSMLRHCGCRRAAVARTRRGLTALTS
jgi:uncharacterized protein YbjQ (UPF0145 family)